MDPGVVNAGNRGDPPAVSNLLLTVLPWMFCQRDRKPLLLNRRGFGGLTASSKPANAPVRLKDGDVLLHCGRLADQRLVAFFRFEVIRYDLSRARHAYTSRGGNLAVVSLWPHLERADNGPLP
jgi:hypothetical protein